MKKLLLLSAAAMIAATSAMAMGVSEPTLKMVWEQKVELTATETRYGIGWQDVVLTVDKTAKKLVAINKAGVISQIQVANDNFTGTAISCDDQGNLLVSAGFPGVGSSKNWSVVDQSGAVANFALEGVSGRLDQVGRVAGDMLSAEGGYVFLTPSNDANTEVDESAQIYAVKIYKDGETVKTEVKASSALGENMATSCIAQPAMSASEISEAWATSIDECFYWRNSSNRSIKYFADSEVESIASPVSTGGQSHGFDVFELQGTTYAIFPNGANWTTLFCIKDANKNEVVAEYAPATAPYSSANQMSINAEIVSETKANIYVYGCGGFAAQYTFEVPDTATAIESVAVDANAPVEYYNLQGVKVANPENGLFIKKQGNKAVKVIL